MKASVSLRAPAKLNLTLEVLGRRDDGLHGIRSVIVPIDLFDEVTIGPDGDGLVFTCSDSALQSDNLVERALRALPLSSHALRIQLEKRIPPESGMGGGSSDAASVLLAAQRGELPLAGSVDYLALARSLGSDVPFFLVQTAALVEGAGERVTALGAPPHWYAVVVKPSASVSTAEAYRMIDRIERPTRSRGISVSLQMAEALQRHEFDKVVSLLHNDFFDALMKVTPEIAAAAAALRSAGASHAMLTGSGSVVYALARSESERNSIAAALPRGKDYGIYSCAFWCSNVWRESP